LQLFICVVTDEKIITWFIILLYQSHVTYN